MDFLRPINALRSFGLFLLLTTLAGCMRYSEVELLAIRDTQLTQMDANGMEATVSMEISNPNNYRIQVMDPDVDLFLNGTAVGKATLDSVVVLEPRSTRVYSIPLRATFNQSGVMLPLLLGSAMTGTMHLKAQGTVVGKARSLRKRFPFEVEQEISLR